MLERESEISMLPFFWEILKFFAAIDMICCRDWWPGNKGLYTTTTGSESNNHSSGSIAAIPTSKLPSANIQWFNSPFNILEPWRHPPHWLSSNSQTIYSEYYLSPMVQGKKILEQKLLRKFTKDFLFLHDNIPSQHVAWIQNKLAYMIWYIQPQLGWHPVAAVHIYTQNNIWTTQTSNA
jgi:hypothetical protein